MSGLIHGLGGVVHIQEDTHTHTHDYMIIRRLYVAAVVTILHPDLYVTKKLLNVSREMSRATATWESNEDCRVVYAALMGEGMGGRELSEVIAWQQH